ncbi:hypothetical protein ACQ4PT_070230 [Festuca glaucescens]
MPPPRGGDGSEQHHQPATVHRARDEDALSHAPQKKQKHHQRRAASLHDDVLIDILSRVRYRSLCRFKCVSKAWLALCSELDIHNRSPRTVYGYFGRNIREAFGFHDLTAGDGHPPLVDPTLSFLGSYERINVEQCCGGGLLLCKCWESRSDEDKYKYSYVVCNPATEKWTMLPPIEFPGITAAGRHIVEGRQFDLNKAEHKLGFDALNPSRFVVAVGMDNSFGQVREVAIYSSETGRWTSMESKWPSETTLEDCGDEAIFLNGTMHFHSTRPSIVTMDIEAKSERMKMIMSTDPQLALEWSQWVGVVEEKVVVAYQEQPEEVATI